VNQGPAETLYFRTDERSWRLAVDSGPDGGLVGLRLRVPSRRRSMNSGSAGVRPAPS